TATVDTVNPTVTVDLARTTFDDHHNTSLVTFTFSEAPGTSFTAEDLTALLHSSDTLTLDPLPADKVYTATFTVDDNSTTDVAISVAADKFTDLPSIPTRRSSDLTATVDTVNPTVTVDLARTTFDDHHNTSLVTFTFSEAPGTSF